MTASVLWYIVSPLYMPAPGGAGVYYHSLSRALAASGANVAVATERYPGEPAKRDEKIRASNLQVDRFFPYRAGRPQVDLWSFVSYAIQNILFLTIPWRIRRARVSAGAQNVVVLIHSSFFYKPSIMPLMLGLIKWSAGKSAIMAVDVRDPLFDEAHYRIFKRFDVAIGCSLDIVDRLERNVTKGPRIVHIPVPFERPESPSPEETSKLLRDFGLEGRDFVLNPNGTSTEKNFPSILKTILEIRKRPEARDFVLVTVGRSRDWRPVYDDAITQGVMIYAGIVDNKSLLALAIGAKATIILSKSEGLPRSALEAFSMNCPVMVPDIAEFRETIPGNVTLSDDINTLADQLYRVIQNETQASYPIDRHDMTELVHTYRAIEEFRRQGRVTSR